MAAPSKTRASIWSAYSHAASTAGTFSPWIDLGANFPSTINASIRNGATGPTIAGMFIVEYANDYNGGSPTNPIKSSEHTGETSNSGTAFFGPIEVDLGISAIRVGIGSNTGQACVYGIDIGKVDGIA